MALAEDTAAGLRSAWEIAIDIFAPTPNMWPAEGCGRLLDASKTS